MRLVLVGRESLDELEAVAEQQFADVENKDRVPDDFSSLPLRRDSQLGVRLRVRPVRELHELWLVWPMPSTAQFVRCAAAPCSRAG